MHRKFKHAAVLFAAAAVSVAVSSCSIDEDRLNKSETIVVNGREVPTDGYVQGMVRLRLTEELAEKLSLQSDSIGRLTVDGVKSVNDLAAIGITKMERTFPHGGKFEARRRKAGLHLWYDVYFDKNIGLTRAGDELGSIEGVEFVEYRPEIVNLGGTLVPGSVTQTPPAQRNNAATELFNDPYLSQQWHMYNDGTFNSLARSGSDVNVLPVWKRGIYGTRYTTDGREVIVGVVDGGIDFQHKDLKDAMWVNPDPEISKDPSQSHGRNFVNNTYLVTADDHGTHVAGIVGAVGNNGEGVTGVAGGNAAEGIEGVRLMSCQIFEGDNSSNATGEAIAWSADNGAVISQNSWGYTAKSHYNTIAPSDKAGIDYFIKNAGYDENGRDGGNQVGPMAGGIVIFAAGNDNRGTGFPAEYEPCVAVAAIGGDYERTWYTNFGNWVDICAPGGDSDKQQEVLSTVPNDSYGAYEGTSQACPHVSGAAALLVSYFGSQGFTADMLRDILESSARDISQYVTSDVMGHGLVDVQRALATASTVRPDPITDLELSVRSNFVNYSLTIPADEDDEHPTYVNVYYSTSPIDITDSASVVALPNVSEMVTDYAVGDKFSGVISALEFETKYYITSAACDFARNLSTFSAVQEVTTGPNTLPEFVPSEPLDTSIKYPNNADINFRVRDLDGHKLSATVPESRVATVRMLNDSTVRLTISSMEAGTGNHTIDVTLDDGFGGTAVKTVNFEVLENSVPEVIKQPEGVTISPGSSYEMDLTQYFKDSDGDKLSYRIAYKTPGIVNGTFRENILVLAPLATGQTAVTVTAYDAMDETASITFDVTIREGGAQADFYPNPVTDTLYIRTPETVTAASVEIRSASGALKKQEDNMNISSSEPYALDLSALSAGVYTLTLSYGDTKITTDIAKL
ncbi:MAG TPA: S8 family serine peptidase [Candidatus Coprenecus stercoravium]|uniref:S8 family serine peptidase n=1 Tax=Candidatus Coprenecus stercoravium TaxID=2840735 RepID=A0A9D2GP87_9BACT|nr:S8 family serine peptidase [Candidatus Coprenecus stercoravium]